MKTEIITRWIDALRSGKYTQARKKLRDPDTNGMCCLGVLCDLYSQDNPKAGWKPFTTGDATVVPFYNDLEGKDDIRNVDTMMPSKAVLAWADLIGNSEEIFAQELAVKNDSGETFEEIAQRIENYLKNQ
jgi:hypothetical protein